MKDTGVLPGAYPPCSVCDRTLVDTAYSCLRSTCVDPPGDGRPYVQRGAWFCRECYRWHMESAHAIGNLEVLRYLDPERYPEDA